jgi:hypothetical protein
MSKVTPAIAEFVMTWTASPVMLAGRRRVEWAVSYVAPSSRVQLTPEDPRRQRVSTNPAAISFTRTGASSSTTFFVMAGSAAVSAEMSERPGAVRRWPVPLKSKVSRARTSRGVPSLARRQDRCASDITAFRLEVEVRQRSVGRPGPRPDHSTSACQRDTVKTDAQGSTAPAFGDRAAPRPRADAMVLELEARPSVPGRKAVLGRGREHAA